MCMSTPSIPEAEPMPQAAPPPPPTAEAPQPAPAPELVNANAKAPKVASPKTKRTAQQQSAKGTNALKIPMNTGASKKASGGLNIPT